VGGFRPDGLTGVEVEAAADGSDIDVLRFPREQVHLNAAVEGIPADVVIEGP
jgi:hypothetical protein